MGNGRREKIRCPGCGFSFTNWWQHLSLRKKDPVHQQISESLRISILKSFGSDLTAVEVGAIHQVTDDVVLFLWREAHGDEALRQRRRRLRTKTKLPCPVCGKPRGKYAKIYCSPRCANLAAGASPEVCQKRSRALLGRAKTEAHRKHISKRYCQLRDSGLLPAMLPEVRAKNSATKKAMGRSKAVIAATSAYMAKTTPEERKESGRNIQKIIGHKYGVSHSYDIPGIREKANLHKSQAMTRRIASGIPTNDWGRYKRGWHLSPKAGRQWFQSGWELLRMEVLDRLEVSWTKTHHIRIPYKDALGKIRYYVPDFLVHYSQKIYLEEVKGYEGRNMALKVGAAEAYCLKRGWGFKVLCSLPEIRTWQGVYSD